MVRVNGADKWEGDFVGWDGNIARGSDYALAWAQLPYVPGEEPPVVTNINKAVVTNNVTAEANTGNNSASGIISAVRSGDAAVDVTILNILNTNITGNHWYFQMINVFDKLVGNVVFPRPDLSIAMNSHNAKSRPGDEAIYTVSFKNSGTLWA